MIVYCWNFGIYEKTELVNDVIWLVFQIALWELIGEVQGYKQWEQQGGDY